MKTFLDHVASDILQKFGSGAATSHDASAGGLSRIAVVFPNKRASLFLNDALARIAGKPLWSPHYITISELFRQQSKLQVADNIKLVCDLHKVYSQVTGYNKGIDQFYGWGQLLISDFDDIDKNMAPVHQLFTNLQGLHELDDVSYLSDEQRAIIRKFFSNFSDTHSSELKERFLRLWSNMETIYNEFNATLESQGIAYEGHLYRTVAQDTDIEYPYDKYIFVGFNLLQRVERQLFKTLQQQHKALFYWDYDNFYKQSEAGRYISQYLTVFPNEFDAHDNSIFNAFSNPKDITFVSGPTENIQARYVTDWLLQNERIADGRRTAIVMCDESLLGTVIHCLPPQVEHVNVTTGYPLIQSSVASFVTQYLNLHAMGYDRLNHRFRLRYVKSLLRHPLAHLVDKEVLLQSFDNYPSNDAPSTAYNLSLLRHLSTVITICAKGSNTDDANNMAAFNNESMFRAYTLVNRIVSLIDSGDLVVSLITLSRLIKQLIQQTSIPFHGEPAAGIQIMGVLETRNLDFDHVLILSANEGNMPRGISDTSFIPYSLRKAFGLTTVENKVAIYAYYFNRLLSRAKDVTLCYNNSTTDGHSGEMSRFMLQLLVESPHPVRQLTLQGGQHVERQHPRPIAKTPDVTEALRRRFCSSMLTPTAINRYMRCQLQFYYNYVEGLHEPDDNDDEIIDNRTFGNIFHDAAQLVYEKMTQHSRHITESDIDSVLKSGAEIERAVDESIRQSLFQITDSHVPMPELNGLQIINRQVIIHYLRRLLTIDRRLAPFTILGLEKEVSRSLNIKPLDINTTIGGRIDRLDKIVRDGVEQIRVIDYKTGSTHLNPLKSVNDIFDAAQLHNHNDYYLQAFLYARIVAGKQPTVPVAPALLFIQHTSGENYNPILRFDQSLINDVATPEGDHFEELLSEKINEMFNDSLSFVPTDNRTVCKTCPYAAFCGRQNV